MKKFIYFGSSATLSSQPGDGLGTYVNDIDNIIKIYAVSDTITAIDFKRSDGDGIDYIGLTHDDTHGTTGHRAKEIARAIAEIANSTSESGMITLVDILNGEYYNNLSFKKIY